MAILSDDDLAPWARRALDKAYNRRDRARASRDDFAAGFVAALAWVGARSSFRDQAQARLQQEKQHAS